MKSAFSKAILAVSTGIAAILASPAHAVLVEAYESDVEEPTDDPDAFSFELDFEPNVTGDLLADRGDRLGDLESTLKAQFKYEADLSEDLALELHAGGQWASDFETGDDEDESSALITGAKLNLDRGFRRLSPFVSYGFEYRTADFFGDHQSSDHTLALGADIVIYDRPPCDEGENEDEDDCRAESWGYKLTLVPSFERVWSDDMERRRYAPRIKASLSIPLANEIKFSTALDYQYRMFDEIVDGRDDQHRVRASASVDFAGFFDLDWLTSLRAGASWSLVTQPGEGNDESKVSFTPGISLAFKLD